MLVNPGVPLPTRDVFASIRRHATATSRFLHNVPGRPDALIGFLTEHGNDLTPAAIACAPVIGEVLIALRALPGVRLTRMSGSGPTCFALFPTPGEAAAGARRLQADRKNWWVKAATIG